MVSQTISLQFEQYDPFGRHRRASCALVATLLLSGVGIAALERGMVSGPVAARWSVLPRPVLLAPDSLFARKTDAPARPAGIATRIVPAPSPAKPTVPQIAIERPVVGVAYGHAAPVQPAAGAGTRGRPTSIPAAPEAPSVSPAAPPQDLPSRIDADTLGEAQRPVSVVSAIPADGTADAAIDDIESAAVSLPEPMAPTIAQPVPDQLALATPDIRIERAVPAIAPPATQAIAAATPPAPRIDPPTLPVRARAGHKAPAPTSPRIAEAPAPATSTPSSSAAPSIVRPRQVRDGIAFEVATRVNGANTGRLSLLIAGGDIRHPEYACDDISVRLGDLLAILGPRMDPRLFEALNGSQAADEYVTFNDLRAHGIAVSFDHHDRLLLKAA